MSEQTAIAPRPQTALQASSVLSISESERGELYKLASAAVASGIYPTVSNADAAFIVMLKGADLGLAPFEALSSIYLIKGKTHIGYTVLASLMRRHPLYDYSVVELTPTVCTLEFTRGGESAGAFTFTMEDANRAGLTGGQGSNWTKYPQTMLFARAMSLGQRIYCPDLTSSTVYVDTLGESEVPMYDITPPPADVPRASGAQASLPAAAPLFGAPQLPAATADDSAWEADEWIEWARGEGLTPGQVEECVTATCEANGGELIYDDFEARVQAVLAQGVLV